MADQMQLELIKQGVSAWNGWRSDEASSSIKTDLKGAFLSKANLGWTNLMEADLSDADLSEANFHRANLIGADLRDANLMDSKFFEASLTKAKLNRSRLRRTRFLHARLAGADLTEADLSAASILGTKLQGAILRDARLTGASLRRVNLDGADLSGAKFNDTILVDLDLGKCIGLEKCIHEGPSIIDIRTLQRSGSLPLVFLRGVGLPDKFIEYIPSIMEQSIQMYSCFISYSAKDEDFAQRLYADLQARGVRCWFAPNDLRIGAKILDALDQAIRLRDKLLLILSEASLASEWVEDEVTKAFAEERQRGAAVLFPIRLDNAIFNTNEAWALKLRDNRNIGNFTEWKDHDAYQKALGRLLRDLQIEPT